MYNEEVKKQYIESVNLKPDFSENDLSLTLRIFQISEKYEEKFGKDLAYFNANEEEQVYLDFEYATRFQNLRLQKFINMYIRWFKKERDSNIIVPKIPSIMMKNIILQGSKDVFYISEDNFTSLIESLIEAHNLQLAFVFTAMYTGLSGSSWSEISLAKKENIDFEEQTIRLYAYNAADDNVYYSRTIRVSDLFLRVSELADAETEYRDNRGRLLGHYKISDYILKERVTAENKDNIADYVYRQDKRCRDMLFRFHGNPNYAIPGITFQEIRNSGIANFLLRLMKAFDEPVSRIENAINNPYIVKPVMERFNIDEFYLKKVIARYLK